MAAVNYYIGVKKGASLVQSQVVAAASTAGTAVDVEVRIQINDGATATGISKKDTVIALEIIEKWINENGLNHAGAFLPAP